MWPKLLKYTVEYSLKVSKPTLETLKFVINVYLLYILASQLTCLPSRMGFSLSYL